MQVPQVTTTAPARGRKHPNPGMAAMPFPTEARADGDAFWLAEWMRDTAALESLIDLREKQKNPAPALHFALSVAVSKTRDEAHKSLKYAILDGDLLFAHAATTRLATTGAAA